MRVSRIVAAVPAIAMLAFGGLTAKDAEAQGPVLVDTVQVGNLIALALDVELSQIPVTVQVPVGIAANVCNVPVSVLAGGIRTGDAECEAETTSTAFNRIVQRQLNVQ